MKKLTFFPSPYPDECYYSIFCRYFARSGSTSNKRTTFELFGEAQSLASFVFLPRRLELVETWVGTESGITRKSLAYKNSAYPYLSITYPEAMIEGMERVIKTGEADRKLERKAIHKCRKGYWPEYLRYCPECVCRDVEKYGETYWHRLPQLPGVEYCPEHGCSILDSEIHIHQTTMAFQPASYILRVSGKRESTTEKSYRQKYIRIAEDSKWLVEHGTELKGCREITLKYKELFKERGLTTAQGVRYPERIRTEFVKYHGEDFLKRLFQEVENPVYWLELVFVSVSDHLRPLHHILLMEFLKGSAEGFHKAVPDNEPYGNGPWPCINKICSNYGKSGAEKVMIAYSNGQTIGHFRCNKCGMKYQRSRPWQSFEEYAGHSAILDYGHLWYEKLRECVESRKMYLKETAETMKSTPTTVKKRAAEIGLNLHSNRKSCIYREMNRCQIDRSQYFREKVEEALLEYPELTAKELGDLVPGAYQWFHKHDFQWLKERLVTDQEKHYWVKWEKEKLALLTDAYETIKQTGDPDRRITLGWLCTTAGLQEWEIKGRLHRFTDLREFVGEVTESKEQWLKRRFQGIAEMEKMQGRQLKVADIKKNMRLKPNTYRKYAVFMEEMIAELNK